MAAQNQLVEQLARLGDADFVAVIEQARRLRTAHRPPPPERPHEFDRDRLATWYASRHLGIEPNLREVIYLPGNAPGGEIRFLEVNAASSYPDDAPVEAVDFGVDVDLPGEHRLLVADVNPEQWERIKAGSLPLPDGWELNGNKIFRRGR